MLTIGLCGSFQVNYCTEAELAWTLEMMGHTVLRFQENTSRTEDILQSCLHQNVQLFIYVHTHGWNTPGTLSFDQMLASLEEVHIKTASFHLDRFWGIPARESQIGQHYFWHTDVVFTADGGHQEDFARRGVNHVWLPPAVATRHCFIGNVDQQLAYDVIFVGSRNYHSEYPFRVQLIDWLAKTYGSRFRRFGPETVGGVVRESALNDLYASAKIVVGDSCFGGAPYYWSDRVPETLGRGGFLLHPQTLGLNIPGLPTFQPGDLQELHALIEFYLTHPEDRAACIGMAMVDVTANHTYTNRMTVLLETMGLL